MFKNYIKIAVRNIKRNKSYSSVNLIGLSIGLAAFIFIMLWVRDEMSYDQFHRNGDSLYRVVCETQGGPFFGSPAPLGRAVTDEFPEVVRSTRLYYLPRFVFESHHQSFYEGSGIVVDPAFFEMFTFPFVRGSLETGFTSPDHIVITESMAHKYFGNEDPINQKINVEGEGFLVVGGVIRDISANSHLQFDYAVPYVFLENVRLCGLEWYDFNFKTYIQLHPAASYQVVQSKITRLADKEECPQVKYSGFQFSLQPVKDMYLHPISSEIIPHGDIRYVTLFSAVALLILAIACINFINLSTARAMIRAKEVSVRKVVGAGRGQIVLQFFSEFMLFAGLALAISLALVQWITPYFNQLTGKALHPNFLEPHLLGLLFAALVGCGVLAGLYPAWSISLFQPLKFLQKQGLAGTNSSLLRRILVIGQFSLSILLMVCTLVIFRQMQYIQNKSWNLKDDLVLCMPVKENIGTKFNVVKSDLLRNPKIVAVSAKDALPTVINNNTTGVWWTGKTDAQNGLSIETIRVSYDYLTLMGIDLVAGRDFSPERESDIGGGYILNEEAVRQTGLADPVGKEFSLYGKRGAIVGVVKDTYFQTLKEPERPQAYYLFSDLAVEGFFGSVFVRIAHVHSRDDLQEVLAHIQSVWGSVNQLAPFEYHFLDQTIQAQYHDEQRLMHLIGIFSALAIFISCLGLYGLSTFIAERRTKEIGIRKVLGSTVYGIVLLLSRSFVKWVVISNFIAWPVAWVAMNKWLENFAYRIEISGWMFVLPGVLALAIALFTIGWQAIRAATANPVESLRYE